MRPTSVVAALAVFVAGCSHSRAPQLAARPLAERSVAVDCEACMSHTLASDLLAAIGSRVADLKARGGECEAEGEVLARALTGGRIILRPYMWREGPNLASAEGESSGELTLARDIDSLNVGVRSLDDVVRSAEHEAVHIALHIPSGSGVGEELVDEHVTACRSASLR